MSRPCLTPVGAVLAAIVGVAAAGCRSPQPPASTTAAAVTSVPEPLGAAPASVRFFKSPAAAPAFSIQTINGRQLSSASLVGKVTIVNFWATWCGPCKAEIPDLVALQERYRDHVQVIGISEDEVAPDVVQRFADEHKINYPIVMATDAIREIFPGVVALPTSFILDREGRVVQRHVGLLNRATTEHETRALAGLPTAALVELVEPDQPVGLANAAQAKEIPGVDLKPLSAARRVEVLQRLNAEACSCGCGLTIAKCRIDDPSCGVSLPIARRIVREMAAAPDAR
jgi:thiol-disulfide isomerase/thioredoxin